MWSCRTRFPGSNLPRGLSPTGLPGAAWLDRGFAIPDGFVRINRPHLAVDGIQLRLKLMLLMQNRCAVGVQSPTFLLDSGDLRHRDSRPDLGLWARTIGWGYGDAQDARLSCRRGDWRRVCRR